MPVGIKLPSRRLERGELGRVLRERKHEADNWLLSKKVISFPWWKIFHHGKREKLGMRSRLVWVWVRVAIMTKRVKWWKKLINWRQLILNRTKSLLEFSGIPLTKKVSTLLIS